MCRHGLCCGKSRRRIYIAPLTVHTARYRLSGDKAQYIQPDIFHVCRFLPVTASYTTTVSSGPHDTNSLPSRAKETPDISFWASSPRCPSGRGRRGFSPDKSQSLTASSSPSLTAESSTPHVAIFLPSGANATEALDLCAFSSRRFFGV